MPKRRQPEGGIKPPTAPRNVRSAQKSRERAIALSADGRGRFRSKQEGADIVEATERLLDGTPLGQLAQEYGLTKEGMMHRILLTRRLNPGAFRDASDGARALMAQTVLDDAMYWRQKTREERERLIPTKDGGAIPVIDWDAQKVATVNYHKALDFVFKLFNLSAQTIEVTHNTNRPALTIQELAARSSDPDVAEAIEAVVVAVHNATNERAA